MPIYEYHCSDCGKNFEALVFKNEKPGCPACQSTNINKLMSSCGFVSKGTSADGSQSVKTSAGTSACAGCTATSCASCGTSK